MLAELHQLKQINPLQVHRVVSLLCEIGQVGRVLLLRLHLGDQLRLVLWLRNLGSLRGRSLGLLLGVGLRRVARGTWCWCWCRRPPARLSGLRSGWLLRLLLALLRLLLLLCLGLRLGLLLLLRWLLLWWRLRLLLRCLLLGLPRLLLLLLLGLLSLRGLLGSLLLGLLLLLLLLLCLLLVGLYRGHLLRLLKAHVLLIHRVLIGVPPLLSHLNLLLLLQRDLVS